ncbi:kinase-like domain-containing protein [Phycomyces blakesleeanus]
MQSACLGQINNRLFSVNYNKKDDTTNPTTTVQSYDIADTSNPAQSTNTVNLLTTANDEIYEPVCAFDPSRSEFYVLGKNADKVSQVVNVFNVAADGLSLGYSWQIRLGNTIKDKIVSVVPFDFQDASQCVALLDINGSIYSTCRNLNGLVSRFPYQSIGSSIDTTRLARISNQGGTAGYNILQFGYTASTIIEFNTSNARSNTTSSIAVSYHKLATDLSNPVQAYEITKDSRNLLILSKNSIELFYVNVPVGQATQLVSANPDAQPTIFGSPVGVPTQLPNVTTISSLSDRKTRTPTPTSKKPSNSVNNETEEYTDRPEPTIISLLTSLASQEKRKIKRRAKRDVTPAPQASASSDPSNLVPNRVGLPSSLNDWNSISIFVQPAINNNNNDNSNNNSSNNNTNSNNSNSNGSNNNNNNNNNNSSSSSSSVNNSNSSSFTTASVSEKRSIPGVDDNSGTLLIGGYNGEGQFSVLSEAIGSLEYPYSPPGSAGSNGPTGPSSKAGPIAGGVVGGVLALALLIFLFMWCRRKNRRRKHSTVSTRSPVMEELPTTLFHNKTKYNEDRSLYIRMDIPYGMLERYEPDALNGASILDPYVLSNDTFDGSINENRIPNYATRTCMDSKNGTREHPKLYTIHYFTTANYSAFVQSIRVAKALASSPHAVKHIIAFDIQTPTANYGYRYYWVSSLCTASQTLLRMLTHDPNRDSFYEDFVSDFDFKTWSTLSILSALADMHTHRYVHLGLSLESFVYQAADSITDWRVCCFDQSLEAGTYNSTGVVLNSMSAPELFKNAILRENGHYKVSRLQANPAVDLWSVGCIIYQLAARRPLFKDSTEANKILQQDEEQINAWLTKAFLHISSSSHTDGKRLADAFVPLLVRLLVVDPAHRVSAREISESWREEYQLNEDHDSE